MKKTLSLLLGLLLVFMCAATTPAEGFQLGDVDRDGSITAADAALILRSLVKLCTLDAEQEALADVDEDGRVTATDAVAILRYLVRLDTLPPGGYLYNGPRMALADFPRIDGSVSAIPLALALTRAATGCTQEEAEIHIGAPFGFPVFSTSSYSYVNALALEGDFRGELLLAYALPSNDKYEIFDQTPDELFDIQTIGYDGLVFTVNENNPVTTLTVPQVRDIYSGKITNWKALGGADCPIRAFERIFIASSQVMMDKLVMDGMPMSGTVYQDAVLAGDFGTKPSAYDNSTGAIGYTSCYYAKNLDPMPAFKLLSVDGVAPTNESIGDGSYPLVSEFYAVLPTENPNQKAIRLRNWLLSQNGQDFLATCGYVPVMASKYEATPTPPPVAKSLFDDKYCAVLPNGDGIYVTYDSMGQKLGSFSSRGLQEFRWFMSPGLYTPQELAENALFSGGRQQEDLDWERSQNWTYRFENGFYRYDWSDGKLYVYDKQFKLRYTVDSEPNLPDWWYYHDNNIIPVVQAIGENELIHYMGGRGYPLTVVIRPQVRAKDGALVGYAPFVTPDMSVAGVFADKYFIIEKERTEEAEGSERRYFSVYDLDGTLLAENVNPVWQDYFSMDNRGRISRQYIKGGILYDSGFQPLSPVQQIPNVRYYLPEELGGFISTLMYDIDGVAAAYHAYTNSSEPFIQGYNNGYLHIKRGDKTYRFAVDASKAYCPDFNDSFLILGIPSRPGSGYNFDYTLLSLKDGKQTMLQENLRYAVLRENYAIVYNHNYKQAAVINKDGNVRFQTAADNISPLPGDVIWLERGPFAGIADLDGNWLIKTLRGDLAGDALQWWG